MLPLDLCRVCCAENRPRLRRAGRPRVAVLDGRRTRLVQQVRRRCPSRSSSAARRFWSPASLPATFRSAAPAAAPPWPRLPAGQDLKIIATFSSRNTFDLVTQPNIKRPEDLRGKRIGLTSIGGTTWMALLLWLEHFGLDAQRDQMQLQVTGEQALTIQALEAGLVNAAILDGIFSRRLKPKGFNDLGRVFRPEISVRQPSAGRATAAISSNAAISWKIC